MKSKSDEGNSIKRINTIGGLVSIIIPTFNRRRTLSRAIQSVLHQTYSLLEIIIIDDGSTDDTESVIKGIYDDRIVYRKIPKRQGAAHARNIGMKMAKGDYIAFQDSDDYWYEGKLETQIKYLNKTGSDIVFCPYYRINLDGKRELVPDQSKQSYDAIEKDILEILKRTNVIGTPTILMRRKVVEEIGGFDVEMQKIEDYEYAIRLAQRYKIAFFQEPLVEAYMQDDSITYRKETDWDAHIIMLRKHKNYLDVNKVLTQLFKGGFLLNQHGIDEKRIDTIKDILGEQSINILLDVFSKSILAYQDILIIRYERFVTKLENREFYIYGAGQKGIELYKRLKKISLYPACFIVSDKSMISEDIEGIPVKGLVSIRADNPKIIIAVSISMSPIFINNLLEKGYIDYCVYPY